MNEFSKGALTGAWIVLLAILAFLIITDNNTPKASELDDCRAEATAWYNATTSLSDAIVFAALKGLPAEKIDTNVATAFAVKAHEINCIQPKLPTG